MDEQLERRVTALERALTDGDGDAEALAEGAATAERITDLEERIAAVEDSVAELDAATQALRGYVGNVRAVNEEVQQRADLALAKAESLEGQRRVASHDHSPEGDAEDGREGDRCDRCGHALRGTGVETDGPRAGTGRKPAGRGRTTMATGEGERGEDPPVGTDGRAEGGPGARKAGRMGAGAEAGGPGSDPLAGSPGALGAATGAGGGDREQVSADGGDGGPIDRLRRLL